MARNGYIFRKGRWNADKIWDIFTKNFHTILNSVERFENLNKDYRCTAIRH